MNEITCPAKTVEGGRCGQYPWTEASPMCEAHYKRYYPDSYARIKNEVKCPACAGFGYRRIVNTATEKTREENCEKCNGRGWVNERK